MALDAATLVRAASGLMFVAVGILALYRGPPRGRWALATALAAFGASFVVVNVFAFGDPRTAVPAIAFQAGGILVMGLAFAAYAVVGPWTHERTRREARAATVAGAIVGLASAFAATASTPGFEGFYADVGLTIPTWLAVWTFLLAIAVGPFALVVGVVAAREAARAQDPRIARAYAFLTLGITAHASYNTTSLSIVDPGNTALAALALLTTIAVPAAWLLLPGPLPRLVAWGTLLAAVFGAAEQLVFGDHESAAPGVLRTIAALLVALALLDGALEGRARPRGAVSRSALAASALATLFIVAQVAQNFLSAEYGLVMGGVVAGAFLFAASPIQRAIEGVRGPGPAPAAAPGRAEEVYRDALRVALRDRVLTREEEVRLHRVAEQLGIGAGRAHEILLEVERETR